jgi:hypothetical protein
VSLTAQDAGSRAVDAVEASLDGRERGHEILGGAAALIVTIDRAGDETCQVAYADGAAAGDDVTDLTVELTRGPTARVDAMQRTLCVDQPESA